jgi:methyl-accepting chemotaxis protein
MRASNLQTRVESLAIELDEIDHDAAERLRDIRAMMEEGPRRRELAYMDVRTLLDPQGMEERAIIQRRPRWINWVEWLRNILVLFPIAFTWIGLSQASLNYSRVIALDPELVNTPFLLLWENGFQELGGRHGPTFSELALVDFLVLAVVIGMTVVVHRWRDIQEHAAERRASELRSEAEQIIWELDRHLAVERSNQDLNQAAQRVGDAVEHFRVHANELLDLMLAERRRLEGIATARDKELGELQLFSEATGNLLQYGQSVERVYDRLQAAVDRFTDEIQRVGQQQEQLIRSLDAADIGSHEMTEAVRALRQGLGGAVTELSNAAARSADNVVAVTAAINEMRDLAARLMEEDTALRKALLETREANREITKNLQTAANDVRDTTSVTQMAASTLRQAVNELAKLIQTNGEMAAQLSQSAAQMTHVAEDLSATTYQATSQLKSTAGMSQQAASALGQFAGDLTRAIQSNSDLTQQLTQSVGEMARVADTLGASATAATGVFAQLQPVAADLHEAVGLLSRETRRLSETVGNVEAVGGRMLLRGESLRLASSVRRTRWLYVALGLGYGLAIGAGVYVMVLLGVLPVLR